MNVQNNLTDAQNNLNINKQKMQNNMQDNMDQYAKQYAQYVTENNMQNLQKKYTK